MSVGLPHSEKLRLAIVRAFNDEGFTYAQIARLLDVGEATVSRTLRLFRETGGVTPRPRGPGRQSAIRGDVAKELKRLVKQSNDATSAELRETLIARTGVKTSISSVKRALKRLGFSSKKRSS